MSSQIDTISDNLYNTSLELSDYQAFGDLDALQEAQDDAALLNTILTQTGFTATDIEQQLSDLITESEASASLINSIIAQLPDGTDADTILTELETLSNSLNTAITTTIPNLEAAVEDAESQANSVNVLNVQLETLIGELDNDLLYYENEIAAVEDAVEGLGVQITGLEDYLTTNYGYNEGDGSLTNGIVDDFIESQS